MNVLTSQTFIELFSGNTTGYGVHEYGEVVDGKKELNGKTYTKNEMVLDHLYEDHLNGKRGLGISPITPNSTCKFGVIDVDVYNSSFDYLLDLIYQHNLPLFPFRSKSGGWHLYMFLEEPVKAKTLIEVLREYCVLLGLSLTTEVFPKQNNLKSGGIGNWINLPYYNKDKAKAVLVKADRTPATLEEALQIIKSRMATMTTAKGTLETVELHDAPPCLQHIYLKGDTTSRNNYLFSLAVYFKAKYGDQYETHIDEANRQLGDKQLPSSEVYNSVIKSHEKKDYTYRCSQDPIVGYCNKITCKNRQYGIGGDEVSELTYEDFYQHMTDPPTYEWVVDGKPLRFEKESDIINQAKFRELCFRTLHKLPGRLKENNWCKIVNSALLNIKVITIAIEEDMSTGAIFMEHLTEFMTGKSMAIAKEDLLLDKVYHDKDLGAYIFKAKNLYAFLRQVKQFRAYSDAEVRMRILDLGGKSKCYYINKKNRQLRAWQLPVEALSKFIDETKIDEFDVDFSKDYDEKPY